MFSSAFETGGEPMAALAPLTTADEPPDVVFYGHYDGAAELRRAMADAGYAGTPYLNIDTVFDGSGAAEESFIHRTGPAAVGARRANVARPRQDSCDQNSAHRAGPAARPAGCGSCC